MSWQGVHDVLEPDWIGGCQSQGPPYISAVGELALAPWVSGAAVSMDLRAPWHPSESNVVHNLTVQAPVGI